jgi:hypothetical protein
LKKELKAQAPFKTLLFLCHPQNYPEQEVAFIA